MKGLTFDMPHAAEGPNLQAELQEVTARYNRQSAKRERVAQQLRALCTPQEE